MNILDIKVNSDWTLLLTADDGRVGCLDIRPFLQYEVFEPLKEQGEFQKVSNGGYFIEWDCGADLSADTVEAEWQLVGHAA